MGTREAQAGRAVGGGFGLGMGRRRRFGLWAGSVVLALGLAPAGGVVAWAGLVAGLSAQLVLLLTTPADAIKLPRWASVLLIAFGGGWVWWCFGAGGTAALVWCAAGLVVTGVFAAVCRRLSPWWAVFVCWWPWPLLVVPSG